MRVLRGNSVGLNFVLFQFIMNIKLDIVIKNRVTHSVLCGVLYSINLLI